MQKLGFAVAIFGSFLLVSACTQTEFQRYEQAQTERENALETSLARGDYKEAYNTINERFISTSTIQELTVKFPEFAREVGNFLYLDLGDISDKSSVIEMSRRIESAVSFGFIDETVENDLTNRLGQIAMQGNLNGTFEFVNTDDYKGIPALVESEAEIIIFERSLEILQNRPLDRSLFLKTLHEAKAKGKGSIQYTMMLEALPTLPLTRKELHYDISNVFPEFAESALADISANIYLVTEPPDRLLYDDLAIELEKIAGINVVSEFQSALVEVEVTKLQFDESPVSERTQTIVLGYGQVDVVSRVLLMPKNASYLYDYITASGGIDYAIEIRVKKDGSEIYNELVRNRISVNHSYCLNARIQNVFGGIQPADFFANDAMKQHCSGRRRNIDMSDLRRDVYKEVSRRIAAVPVVRERIE